MAFCAEESASESTGAEATTDWKQEISSDKAAIKTERDQMKTDSSTARQEEKALHRQIKQAMEAGDTQKAESLRAQVKAMHQENVQQKEQDRQDLNAARQEMRSDKKEAQIARKDANHDGTVDQAERARHPQGQGKRDKDNNPPGPKGGQGTNWENPPGATGGPGAGPDRGGVGRRDKDNNPPGPKGGQGTNWENRPGPQGGPGASPNRSGGQGSGGNRGGRRR